jgi:hypothetical protein
MLVGHLWPKVPSLRRGTRFPHNKGRKRAQGLHYRCPKEHQNLKGLKTEGSKDVYKNWLYWADLPSGLGGPYFPGSD